MKPIYDFQASTNLAHFKFYKTWTSAKSRTFLAIAILFACHASAADLVAHLFGLRMNDVVSRVEVLVSPDSEIAALGLDFSPDGEQIAIGSFSDKIHSESIPHAQIHIWNWRSSRIARSVVMPAGFGTEISTNPISYSPDGRLLAVCDGGGAGGVVARFWNTITWSIEKDLVEPTSGLCTGYSFTPDSKRFIRLALTAGLKGDAVIAYDVATWQIMWGLPISLFSPRAIAISPDGSRAALSGTFSVIAWQFNDPVQRAHESKDYPEVQIIDLTNRSITKKSRISTVGPLAWSIDGKKIAVAGAPGIEVIDAQSGELLVRESLPKGAHMNAKFSSDGHYLVESDFNGRGNGLGVKIWDTNHQRLLQAIPGNIGCIAISKDSKYLALGEPGRTTIWRFK